MTNKPPITTDQLAAAIVSLKKFEEAADSTDHEYEMECRWLKMEISELNRSVVKPGDGSLPSKAKRVLEMGARHIAEDRPSPEFLQWVAVSIQRTLNCDEHTLGGAFRLENPPNRPKKDPYADHAIKAALDHIHAAFLARNSGAGAPPDVARKQAVDIAYKIRWGATTEQHKAAKIGSETIRSRRRTIGDTLAELGH